MAYLIPPMDDEPPADYLDFVCGRLATLRSEASRLVGGDRYATEVYMEVLTDLAGHWRRLCWRSRVSHRDAITEFLNRRLATRTRQWREDQIYPVEVSVLRPPDALHGAAFASASSAVAPTSPAPAFYAPTSPAVDSYTPDSYARTTSAADTYAPASSAPSIYERDFSAAATTSYAPAPSGSGAVGQPVAAVATVAQQLAPLLPTTVRKEVGVVAEAEIAWLHAYRRYLWRRYCRVGGGVVLLIGYLVQFMSQASSPG
jgi:hypothetical protein